MLKKYNIPTLITIFCFIVSVAALVNDLFFLSHNMNVLIIKQLFSPLALGWVFGQHLISSMNGINYINGFFDVLLLLGVLLYATNQHKETRLIRLVMAVIFLCNIAGYFYSAVVLLSIPSFKLFTAKRLLYDSIGWIIQFCWIYISYKILRYLNSEMELQAEFYGEGDAKIIYFKSASLWQRFLHPVVDTIIAIMIFAPLISLIIQLKTGPQTNPFFDTRSVSESFFFGTVIFFRVIYYLIYEGVFGITPAKLLTETTVINDDGNKPALKDIVVRTLTRLIPFEAFTFFTSRGLHDKFSNTIVAITKRKL